MPVLYLGKVPIGSTQGERMTATAIPTLLVLLLIHLKCLRKAYGLTITRKEIFFVCLFYSLPEGRTSPLAGMPLVWKDGWSQSEERKRERDSGSRGSAKATDYMTDSNLIGCGPVPWDGCDSRLAGAKRLKQVSVSRMEKTGGGESSEAVVADVWDRDAEMQRKVDL